ncbi:CybS protein [Phlyctema vagabunda]|uniref:Succinate dehydrogenase [ubiquinone] cytochrome b small subunit n=1 Tax=Phlyctema vagabunda TaxID=108571 RepID=A0ABR4PPR1_9HELO
MASIVRPNMLRQAGTAVAKRSFSTQVSSTFPAAKKSASAAIARPALRNAFAKDVLPSSIRVAAFHAGGRKAILPNPPQVLEGSVNDAAEVPHSSPTHGSYHWTFERLISAGLVPLTIAPFAAGSLNPLTDAVLCGTVLIHSHIGFQSVITDYLPNWRVPKWKKAAWWALNATTVMVGVGLYEFETNDVGVTEAIKRVWTA